MKKISLILLTVCCFLVMTTMSSMAEEGSGAEVAPAGTETAPVVKEAAPAAKEAVPAAKEAPAEEAAPAAAAAENSEPAPVPLDDSDCIKCHRAEVVDVDENGASHKDVGCTECHLEHPPAGKNCIPECSMCHMAEDNPHFAVPNCVSCHYPHHPLKIDFTKAKPEAKPACIACHAEQDAEMKLHPSAHSEQDCNNCHYAHGLGEGQYNTCVDCHDAHSDDMKAADCFLCHRPHSPTDVTYGDNVAPVMCAACHDSEAGLLAASKTAHHDLACYECHPEHHKNIMQCEECHDQPHDEYIHNKFPKCLDCHRDPHNLAK